MNRAVVSAAMAAMALLLSASWMPAAAGSGQYKPSRQECAPGRPHCVCPPGRPGCDRPSHGQRPGKPYHRPWLYAEPVPPGYYVDHGHGGYRISCNSAMNKLSDRGYRGIVAKDCSGRRYNFTARKNGHRFWISFNASTGRFTRSVM